MNTVVLRRRLVYICAMVVLLVPLYFLGNPSVRRSDGSVRDQGGTLAQLRSHYDLGQSDIGELDPASESVRLATLGLRGVAATILWQKAEYYKKEQYWDRLSATLNQIAVLQPHFVKVWEFQAHNLSYNVSVEFDDYKQRYEWVKRGIDYLVKGSKYNKQRTEMPYELGWFFGNKMGVADEKVQFREMYRNDENFHEEIFNKSGMDLTQQAGQGPDGKPDNWRSGTLWYNRAYEMVSAGSRPARSAMMFYRLGPQWQMKYAEAVQSEGILDDPARIAWESAGRGWEEFGNRQIRTTFGDTIFLNEIQVANDEYAKLKAKFEEFCGQTFEKALAERKAGLSSEVLAAYEKDDLERRFDEVMLAEQAEAALRIAPYDLAREMPEEKRVEALQLAQELQTAEEKIQHIEVYRNQINYAYWKSRCEAEQEDAAMLARSSMYEANELLDKGELDKALEQFEIAWENWTVLFNAHPSMMVDEAADDVLKSIERYRRLLDQPDLPEDFALSNFMKFKEIYDEDLADPALMGVISSWPQRYPGRNFLEDMLRKSEVMEEALRESGSKYRDDEAPAVPGITGLSMPPIKVPGSDPASGPIPRAESVEIAPPEAGEMNLNTAQAPPPPLDPPPEPKKLKKDESTPPKAESPPKSDGEVETENETEVEAEPEVEKSVKTEATEKGPKLDVTPPAEGSAPGPKPK